MTEPITVRWRVIHKQSGLMWRWNDLTKAQAQVALWQEQGDRNGMIVPVLYRGEEKLADEEVAQWFAAAFQALTAQQEAGEFTRPEAVFANEGTPTESFLRNGYVITTALVVEQYYRGGAVTLSVLNSRRKLANGFIRLHPETMIRLAWWVLANRAALLAEPKDGGDG